MRFCVLITSADSRKDIFDICFANVERIWKNCPWPRFAKFGTFKNWCQQVTAHVNELPPEIEYILLMVEDVLFMSPVDGAKLQLFADYAARSRLPYLQLVPLRDDRHCFPYMITKIPKNHPYYSSTEMALWRRDYLLEQLGKSNDPWAFEHLAGADHWVIHEHIFDQHQIVQKGRWNWDAPLLMALVMDMPPTRAVLDAIADILTRTRPFQTIKARLRGHWQNLSFALFGFTSFKIKRWLHETYRRHSRVVPRP